MTTAFASSVFPVLISPRPTVQEYNIITFLGERLMVLSAPVPRLLSLSSLPVSSLLYSKFLYYNPGSHLELAASENQSRTRLSTSTERVS